MTSDPALLDAFRKACRHSQDPNLAFMVWALSDEPLIDRDDMIDVLNAELAARQLDRIGRGIDR